MNPGPILGLFVVSECILYAESKYGNENFNFGNWIFLIKKSDLAYNSHQHVGKEAV